MYVVLGILYAVADTQSDMGAYYAMLVMPLTCRIYPQSGVLSYILMIALAPLPVLISVCVDKILSNKNKAVKIIGCIVVVLPVISLAVKGGYSTYMLLRDSYIGDDGKLYVAFYDIDANKYEDNSEVPYYETNGNKYYWTYNGAEYDEDDILYCGEITDTNGKTYNLDNVYVNVDGYIYIDESDEIQWRDDIPYDVDTDWNYCDNDGNIYTSILCIHYLSDGTPYTAIGDEYKTK